MNKMLMRASLLMAASAIPLAPALAQGKNDKTDTRAQGTPQRGTQTPPGIARLLHDMTRGIARAIIATEGSNSRLQDHPVSP